MPGSGSPLRAAILLLALGACGGAGKEPKKAGDGHGSNGGGGQSASGDEENVTPATEDVEVPPAP